MSRSPENTLQFPTRTPGSLRRRLAFERTSSSAPPRWETRLNKRLDAQTVVDLVDAMAALPQNIVVQRQGCYALWKISLDGIVGRQAALVCGGANAAAKAMHDHRRDLEIARHACAALANLTVDEPGCVAVVDSAGVAAVVTALHLHKDDVELQRLGIGALQNLCFGNAVCKQAVIAADGIKATVDIMRAWLSTIFHGVPVSCKGSGRLAIESTGDENDPDADEDQPMLDWSVKEIQRNGCGTLRNLAMGNAAFKDHICNVGGVGAIIGAMVTYRDYADVQVNACAALQHLVASADHEKGETEHDGQACDSHNSGISRKVDVLEQGGLAELITAIRHNPIDRELQRCGCAALASLAWSDAASKKALLRQGVLEAVIGSMAALHNDLEVQRSGSRALRYMVQESTLACAKVHETDGSTALVAAMLNFSHDLIVQRNGCAALSNLTSSEQNEPVHPKASEGKTAICQAVISAGGPSAVVLALSEHRKDALVQQDGCSALMNLARVDGTCRSILVEAGACQALVESMQAHIRDVVVQRNGVLGLRNISTGDSKYAHTTHPNKQAVVDAGGSTAIINALAAHPGSADVQAHGNAALQNIASTMRHRTSGARRQGAQGGGDSRRLASRRECDIEKGLFP